MRREPIEEEVFNKAMATGAGGEWSTPLRIAGSVLFGYDSSTDELFFVPLVVGVYSYKDAGDGTLEVEIWGSFDGTNYEEAMQVVAAQTDTTGWVVYHPKLKYYPYLKFKFICSTDNFTNVTCRVAFG